MDPAVTINTQAACNIIVIYAAQVGVGGSLRHRACT